MGKFPGNAQCKYPQLKTELATEAPEPPTVSPRPCVAGVPISWRKKEDTVLARALLYVMSKPGTVWRPSRECRTTVDFMRQREIGANRELFLKCPLVEALLYVQSDHILTTSAESIGEKPWLTWFVPAEEFKSFKAKLKGQKRAMRIRRWW